MLKIILARQQQRHQTLAFPRQPPALPDRFQGRPVIEAQPCEPGCARCAAACPVEAIALDQGAVRLDAGRCLFCGACAPACPVGKIRFSGEYRLAVRRREDMIAAGGVYALGEAVEKKIRKLYGRSFKLRQVSAGGCNACEADCNVLATVGWDLGRFGIQFVASPRHADGLLVTGPVTANMRLALLKTYEAVPGPKLVIATGACAISGGPYAGHPEAHCGVAGLLPVDMFIPGCPPHPATILDGLLRLLGRLG